MPNFFLFVKIKNMNRIVVITGASSGIGLNVYRIFEDLGDTPICLSLSNPENLKNFILCDVSNLEQVKQAFNIIKEKFQKIDILINNAGFGISGAVELEKPENFQKIFDVDFFGTIHCYQNAVPLMNKGSKIINISSTCALFSLPFRGFYCAVKSALSSISYAERMELMESGISVVSICPGETKSNFNKNRIRNMETNERYKDRIQSTTNKIKNNDSSRMETSYVANKIVKICNKKRPKPMYIIGNKYKFLYFCSRFLPMNALLKLTNKYLGK